MDDKRAREMGWDGFGGLRKLVWWACCTNIRASPFWVEGASLQLARRLGLMETVYHILGVCEVGRIRGKKANSIPYHSIISPVVRF